MRFPNPRNPRNPRPKYVTVLTNAALRFEFLETRGLATTNPGVSDLSRVQVLIRHMNLPRWILGSLEEDREHLIEEVFDLEVPWNIISARCAEKLLSA
jgi:hypothetical protein